VSSSSVCLCRCCDDGDNFPCESQRHLSRYQGQTGGKDLWGQVSGDPWFIAMQLKLLSELHNWLLIMISIVIVGCLLSFFPVWIGLPWRVWQRDVDRCFSSFLNLFGFRTFFVSNASFSNASFSNASFSNASFSNAIPFHLTGEEK